MTDLISIALTGLQSSQQRSLAAANNLANLNTPAYQAKRLDTVSLTGLNGAMASSVTKSDAQGSLAPTGNPLDVAIMGNGYFQLSDSQGNLQFSRDGSFSLNSNGELVNSQGFKLDPPVRIPENADSVSIDYDGTVTAKVAGVTREIGSIQLAVFGNPSGLADQGNNMLTQTGSSGIPRLGDPGRDGRGYLQSGFLEGSNVDIATDSVALLTEESIFKANAAVVKTADALRGVAIDLIR